MIMKLFILVSHKVAAGVDQYKPQQIEADYFRVDLPKTQHHHSLPTKFRYKMWMNG
jgi:hypothetical protein